MAISCVDLLPLEVGGPCIGITVLDASSSVMPLYSIHVLVRDVNPNDFSCPGQYHMCCKSACAGHVIVPHNLCIVLVQMQC